MLLYADLQYINFMIEFIYIYCRRYREHTKRLTKLRFSMKFFIENKFAAILLVLFIAITFAACEANFDETVELPTAETIMSHVNQKGNPLPSQFIDFQFQEFNLPSEDNYEIIQTVRFENITDETLNIRVWAFYDKSIYDLIIARHGEISFATRKSPIDLIEVTPGMGYVVGNSTALLYEWDEYTEKDFQRVEKGVSELYFQMEINSFYYESGYI